AAPPKSARSLVVAAPGTITASTGASAATVTVTANDEFGNPVSGVTVTLGATGTGNALAQPAGPTGPNGQVTGTLGSTKAETKTISATLNGVTQVGATASVSVTPAAAASIAVSTGDGQTATVGTAVLVPPAVIGRDAVGNPVAGGAVTLAACTRGGSVTPTSPVTTGADGVAAVTAWTLGPTAGSNTLTAASGSLAGSPVTFTATGTAGTATRLAIATQPSGTVQSGIEFQQQPAIQLQDASGNLVSQAGIVVGVRIASGGGTRGGATSATTDTAG